MTALATLIAGRRWKFLFLAGWIVLIVGLGPFAGKFEGAQKNEPSSFLPGSAESVKALEVTRAFEGGTVTPAVVVYRAAAGLTDAHRAAVEADRAELNAKLPAGASAIGEPAFSEDGKAALLSMPIEAKGDEKLLLDAVDTVKEAVHDSRSDGLKVEVSGPAGFSADASEVFEGINSTLLYATGLLVFFLLIIIYRSPIFWILPLLSVIFAEVVVRGIGYALAKGGVIINGQTGGILLVLVFGAGTDYALLLTARYREELRRHEDKHEAMLLALRTAGPTILASAGTVVAGLLCLMIAEVNATSGLGPVAAMGVAVAALAMLTLLPVLLLIGGRRAFWPFVPRFGESEEKRDGLWGRLGSWIDGRHRPVWLLTALALVVCALGTFALNDKLTTSNAFRGSVEAVRGQQLINESFPAGANAPTTVVVLDQAKVEPVREAVSKLEFVDSVGEPETGPTGTRFSVTLEGDPFGEAGFDLIPPLREAARSAGGESALVGGPTAQEHDLRESSSRDVKVLVPIVLLVVFLILVLLLRAVVAPLLLMGTVVLSFFASIGISIAAFRWIFDFPGEDPSYLLFAFIFLVALGVDYNIFLMARVREEAQKLRTGAAMRRGLSVTGGVITSAGVVLAGTFAVLAVLPIIPLTQIGFTVALGVLIDTLIVRSILVPALTFEAGERIWWPSALARRHFEE
jgi:RND superfamily putative drug exporter